MNEDNKIYLMDIEYSTFHIFYFEMNVNMPNSDNKEYIEIYDKIYQYIVIEKHFLDKDLTINIIVRKFAVKKNSLNKVLRLKEDMAFHAYINRLRVLYASTLLLDPSNKLIDVIALEASFNNTRTFVRNFKVEFKMTPSEYRRRYGFK